MGDHRDAHAVERRPLDIRGDAVHHLVHRHGGPIDADEVAVGIVALGLAVAGKAAIGAIGPATFGIGQQQVQAARAGAVVHLAIDQPQRDRRRGGHLHIIGRAHMRRHHPVVGAVEAVGRDARLFHRAAVAQRLRHRRRGAGKHHLGRVEAGGGSGRGASDLIQLMLAPLLPAGFRAGPPKGRGCGIRERRSRTGARRADPAPRHRHIRP